MACGNEKGLVKLTRLIHRVHSLEANGQSDRLTETKRRLEKK